MAVEVRKGPAKKQLREPLVSRYRKPPEMSLEEWQVALRRQFGGLGHS